MGASDQLSKFRVQKRREQLNAWIFYKCDFIKKTMPRSKYRNNLKLKMLLMGSLKRQKEDDKDVGEYSNRQTTFSNVDLVKA